MAKKKMNRPYTCHNCGTVFDACSDSLIEEFESNGLPLPNCVKAWCPGCHDHGFNVAQARYDVELTSTGAKMAKFSDHAKKARRAALLLSLPTKRKARQRKEGHSLPANSKSFPVSKLSDYKHEIVKP